MQLITLSSMKAEMNSNSSLKGTCGHNICREIRLPVPNVKLGRIISERKRPCVLHCTQILAYSICMYANKYLCGCSIMPKKEMRKGNTRQRGRMGGNSCVSDQKDRKLVDFLILKLLCPPFFYPSFLPSDRIRCYQWISGVR